MRTITTRTPTDADRRLGELLREARDSIPMPRREVALALGVTAQQVWKYETGEDRITIGRLLSWCDVLRLDVCAVVRAVQLAMPKPGAAA